MPFLTRPHFEDRQIVQYSDESISLSGTSYIAATVLDFTGTTTGETSVTINSLTGYLNGQRLSGLVVEPAQLKLSGSTGTTTQNVTGFVLQSIDPYGSVEWAPLSGVSWSVSACTSPLYVSTIEACPNPTDPLYITAGNVQFGATPSLIADITNTRLGIGTGSPSESLHVEGSVRIVDGTEQNGYVLTSDANGVGTWQYNSTGFSGNTSASCITDLYVSNIYGCSPITIHDSVQHTGSTASGTKSVAFGLDNVTNSDNSAILSGNDNNIDSSDNSTIGGGKFNTITGGTDNFIAAGGFASVANSNQILGASRSFIAGGRANKILISDSSIAGGSSNELNGGTGNFIGAGGGNTIDGSSAKQSSIGGGGNNTIDSSKHSFIGGGLINTIDTSANSFIGGGNTNNLIDSPASSIVGGQDNSLSGSTHSFIGGGLSNVLNSGSTHSFIGGGSGNEISSGSLYSLIIGGLTNRLSNSSYSLISGGLDNIISGNLLGGNSVVGGQNNTINSNFMSGGIYNSIIAGGRNNLINGIDSYIFMGGGLSNTVKTSGDGHSGATIVGGGYNIIDVGFDSGIFGGTYGYVYNSQQSSLIGGAHNSLNNVYNSVVLGGQNITGTTDNTVYTPNLTVRGDYVLHSDEVLEVGDVPGSLEGIMKGSYTEFNHDLTTANVLSNNNPSGFTSFILGDVSQYPTNKPYGFISYFNSGYTRTGTPPVGTDFNRGKLFLKAAEDAVGMVINPRAGDPTAPLWFEMDGTSVMKLQGDGAGKATLGIAMSQDGTETASANLQIGGTGTTGTFKYRDGNQQLGYVLTSDVDGNATWQVSTASGGTSSGNLFSSTERALNNTPLNFGGSSGYTNYTIQNPYSDDPNSMLTGSTLLPSTGGTFTGKTYTLPLGTLDDGDILNFKLKFSRGIIGGLLTVPVTDDNILGTSLSHTQLRVDGDFYDDNYLVNISDDFNDDLDPIALTAGTVAGMGFMYRSDKPPSLTDAQLTGTTLINWDTLVNVNMVRIDATTLNITTNVEYKLHQPWTVYASSTARGFDFDGIHSSSNTNFTVNDMDSNSIVFDAAGWCVGSSLVSPSTSPENIYCDYMIIDLNKKI